MYTLTGIGAALPTLTDDRGAVDVTAHTRLAQHLHTQGAELALVAGTTGRGNTLGSLQRATLCETTSPTLPTVCGIPHDKLGQIEQLAHAGATAALIGFPPDSTLDHIKNAHDKCTTAGILLICYQHTAHNVHINPNWAEHMANNDIMAKHSDPNPTLANHLATHGVGVFIGSTQLVNTLHTIGAIGILNGAASIMFPDTLAASQGDNTAWQRMLDWETDQHTNRIGAIEQTAWHITRTH